MNGALNFYLSDLYGGIYGTTELSIPSPSDQQTMPDTSDHSDVSQTVENKKPIFFTIIAIALIVLLLGVI